MQEAGASYLGQPAEREVVLATRVAEVGHMWQRVRGVKIVKDSEPGLEARGEARGQRSVPALRNGSRARCVGAEKVAAESGTVVHFSTVRSRLACRVRHTGSGSEPSERRAV